MTAPRPLKRAAGLPSGARKSALPGLSAAPVADSPGAGALPPPDRTPAQTSPQRHGRVAAAGKPDTGTGADLSSRGSAPGRVRAPSPAGGELDADSSLSAGQMAIAKAMSEGELEEKVRDLCEGFGVLRFHNPDSRRVKERGLPDDILIGARGVLWRELKNMKRKLTPEQEKVGADLLKHGQDWAVWRPDALLSRRIEHELRAISGLRIADGAA